MSQSIPVVALPNPKDITLGYESLAQTAMSGDEWARVGQLLTARDGLAQGFALKGSLGKEAIICELKANGPLGGLALSADGSFIASGTAYGDLQVISLGNLVSGKLKPFASASLEAPIYSLTFGPESGLILTGNADRKLAIVSPFDVMQGRSIAQQAAIGSEGRVFSVATTRHQDCLGLAGEGFISLLKLNRKDQADSATTTSSVNLEGVHRAGIFLDPLKYFIAGSDSGQIGITATDKISMRLHYFDGYQASEAIFGMDYHAASSRLAVVGPNYIDVLKLGVRSEDIKVLSTHSYQIPDTAFSANFNKRGDKLAVGLDMGCVQVFDVDDTGALDLQAEYRPWSPDSLGGSDISFNFYDMPAGSARGALPPAYPTNIVKFCLHDMAVAIAAEDGMTRLLGDSKAITALGAAIGL